MEKKWLLMFEIGLAVFIITGLILTFFDGVAFAMGAVLLSLTVALLITHSVLLVLNLIKNKAKQAKAYSHEQSQRAKMGKADLVSSLKGGAQ